MGGAAGQGGWDIQIKVNPCPGRDGSPWIEIHRHNRVGSKLFQDHLMPYLKESPRPK